MTLSEVLAWTGGAAHGALPQVFTGVCTDTRALVRGSLFLALRGENFDGHAFLKAAIDGGAGAVVADSAAAVPPGVP
ncbi:MAG: UDP-N-acetylmuramoyl-tripeptide--D-alanyl-D-alanine ligase, partial [Kiritimatiellae bacterium]|nr:UDP-N-acetylmuramoyl-tripeptide--D-alanyl-D-alanine ligase [Kiritimatiellia bacterium]